MLFSKTKKKLVLLLYNIYVAVLFYCINLIYILPQNVFGLFLMG